MFVDTRPRKRNAPRPAEKSAPGFLQYLRGRECLVVSLGPKTDCLCGGRIESAHVDYAGGKGMGTKVADRFAIPLCSEHHAHQHAIGWPCFERTCLAGEGSAVVAAALFWRKWGGRPAWETKHAAPHS